MKAIMINEAEALKDSNSATLFLVGLLKSKVVAPKNSFLSTKLSFDCFAWLGMALPSNVLAVFPMTKNLKFTIFGHSNSHFDLEN